MKNTILLLILSLYVVSCQKAADTNISWKEKPVKEAQFKNNLINVYLSVNNDTVRFFTDTGGGRTVYPELLEKIEFTIDTVKNGDEVLEAVHLKPFFERRNLPAPVDTHFLYRGDLPAAIKGENDGLLGANWFADKTWRFDYKNKQLYIVDSLDWNAIDISKKAHFGFLKNDKNYNSTHFPRIPIVVAGDTIQTLFDTGATAFLNENSKVKLGDHKMVATSFIIERIFEKWKTAHPNWEVIEKGDELTGNDMIQVPLVTIGNKEVGPVWFTKRPDANFTQWMSQWTDKVVEGAIGGSCLQYFSTVIIDYTSGNGYFE